MRGRFEILLSAGVREDLRRLRAYERQLIIQAIEGQLRHAPTVTTKNRKLLRHLLPPFEAVPPIWQLRVGVFRVFYDVEEQEQKVYIRAVRRKPAHLSTEEIL